MLERIISLASQLPTGLADPKAKEKLLAERQELKQTPQHDYLARIMEGADCVYYAAKACWNRQISETERDQEIDQAARLAGVSEAVLLRAVMAKYSLRAIPGNPKDDRAERLAVAEVSPNRLCVWHGGCLDGFAAAWVVYRYFGDDIVFVWGHYGDPPPDVAGREVVIVDFSYGRQVMLEMSQTAKSLVCLDHHKSAQENLAGLDFARFDMERSGAMLAWDYFFPGQKPPLLLNYVQDRDLWRWDLPDTQDITAALSSYPFSFPLWDELDVDQLKIEGAALNRQRQKHIESYLAGWAISRAVIGGYDVPVLNCPRFLASEVLNNLAIGEPFAAAYSDSAAKRDFELRSVPGGMDVSAIAKKYGGGGHHHAAGFSIKKPQVLGDFS